ncbi:MAG: glycosyltransferase family 9 protein [Gammaproteobacteria bacterium]
MTAPASTASERLLVVTLSNIGDLVLTTPVFEALATACPGRLIDVIGDARSSALLRAAPYVGEIFNYDKRASLPERLVFLRRCRTRRYELVVDLRTVHLGWLLRARRRLRKREGRVPGRHAVLEHFTALRPMLGAAAEPPPCRIHLDHATQQRAMELLSDLPGTRWLAVAPGANYAGKKWPREAFADLLRRAAGDVDAVVLLGSAEDEVDAKHLAAAGPHARNLAGRTSLLEAAALLARCRAFVGNDSGLGHMAAAVGVPTLTVFGPGDPPRYRPWGQTARIVCAADGRLERLRAEQVWPDLRAMLAAPGSTG